MSDNTRTEPSEGVQSFLPPETRNTKDEWHVLVVRDVGATTDTANDPDVTLLHPESCGVTVSSRGDVDYECHTAFDIRQGGFHGLFGRHDDHLERGVWLIHPFVEELRGFDWVEHDGGWEAIALTSQESFEANGELVDGTRVHKDSYRRGVRDGQRQLHQSAETRAEGDA